MPLTEAQERERIAQRTAMALPKHALIGTWKLVSATDTAENGERNDAFGSNPAGFLTYTADGRIMGIISHGERKPLSVPDYVGAPPAERAEAFATFLAYAGTYKLEGSHVIHHVEASWLENSVGTEQVRDIVKLEGDQLLLRTPPYLKAGRMVTAELLWKRVKANGQRTTGKR